MNPNAQPQMPAPDKAPQPARRKGWRKWLAVIGIGVPVATGAVAGARELSSVPSENEQRLEQVQKDANRLEESFDTTTTTLPETTTTTAAPGVAESTAGANDSSASGRVELAPNDGSAGHGAEIKDPTTGVITPVTPGTNDPSVAPPPEDRDVVPPVKLPDTTTTTTTTAASGTEASPDFPQFGDNGQSTTHSENGGMATELPSQNNNIGTPGTSS